MLYQPSIQVNIALGAAARVGQARRSSSSALMVEKNDSATALSQDCPLRPTDNWIRCRLASRAYSALVYWAAVVAMKGYRLVAADGWSRRGMG
ncbi:hypothetical protein BAW75_01250 [Micromonospora chalcea]|nr:hypothetical protein BAW75_01250 [Micromonospora chalcea]